MASAHVVVIAFPFSSHTVMFLRLARALAAAAPAATFSFVSTASSLARLRTAGALQGNLRFVEVREGGAGATGEMAAVPLLSRVLLFMASAEAGGLSDALEAARVSAGGARVSCVVADAFMWMSADAAAAVAAPWVPVWTGGPSALLAHLRADALRRDFGEQADASRADELLTSHLGLGSYRVRDLPDGIVSGDPNYPFLQLLRRIEQQLHRASTTVALNTFPGLVPQEVMAGLAAELPNCVPFGPFHLLPGTEDSAAAATDPNGCLAWLDGHPASTVAYVSFGTVVLAGPEELRELAAGLEAAGAPFLWSLREESWPHLPPGFMEHGAGLVVPWVPQVQVLGHASVGAFVTHAGWASVLEGVCAGVPMACRPVLSDQRTNARSVHLWGFGTTIDEPVTRAGVEAVVSSLLNADEGATMWARMQELRGKVASAFAPGGSSRNNFDKFVKMVCALSP
jgi:anthocyanidin 3-O-glucosyltransferase